MTTTDKIQYSSNTPITCTLNSLASSSSAGRGSAAVINATTLYDDAILTIAVTTSTSTLAAPFTCYVYLYGSGADGVYLGSSAEAEGTDTAVTLDVPTKLIGPFVISCPASNVTYRLVVGSVAAAFGGVLPYGWGFVLQNQTGQPLASSGNISEFTGITYTNSTVATLAPPAPVGTVSGGFITVPQQSSIATFPVVANMTIQMTSPVLTNVNAAVFNSLNPSGSLAPPYQYYGDALNNNQLPVTLSAAVPFAATVGSLVKNVTVYMHSAQVFSGVPVGGMVTGTINMLTSNHGGTEVNGPVVLDVYTSDVPPGGTTTTGYQNKIRVMIFITGGSEYSIPTSPGAAGLTVAFESEWTTGGTLSVSSTNLSATWFPGDPGGDYGDAIDQDPDNLSGGPNPFTQMGNYLRIRCEYSPSVTDPLGSGRKWTTGYLSTCFPGGTGFSAALPYYAECRMLVPIGGSPWPSFWQTTQNALVTPSAGVNIETDTVEMYGLFPTNWRSGGILYPAPAGSASVPTGAFGSNGGSNNNNQPGVFPADVALFDFHTFGVLVTSTTTTLYVDNVATGYFPTPALPAGLTGPRKDFFMMDNQFGGGFSTEESELPYSAWYDAWFHFVRVYT